MKFQLPSIMDIVNKFLGSKSHVQISFDEIKAEVEQKGDNHVRDRKAEAAKLMTAAAHDQIKAFGGNPELHTAAVDALVKSMLSDKGVKSKLLVEGSNVALTALAEKLNALLAASKAVADTVAEDTPAA